MTVTSEYGWRTHPIHGDARFHAGIDIVPNTDDWSVRSIAGGEVIKADNTDPNGYGNQVLVRTPAGYVEQYSHLETIGVRPGDVIQPGTSVGVMGSTGGSTGPHVDFVVYQPGAAILQDYQNTTINPRDYMAMVQNVVAQPPGIGLPPNTPVDIPNNLSPLDLAGAYIDEWYRYQNGRVNTGGGSSAAPLAVYNNASPRTNTRAALARDAYRVGGQIQNDPASNYGYSVLAENRDYRIELARVSSRLGIPAQWLADVIDYESMHDAGIINPYGCTGLIQFCPGGGLADVAQELGISEQAATRRLAAMQPQDQLTWVYYYLNRYSNGGRDIHTIEDLYALVNQGPKGIGSTNEERAGWGDANGNLPYHFTRLGHRVGRRYESSYDRLQSSAGHVHEEMMSGCPECNRQMVAFGMIVPHEDPLIT